MTITREELEHCIGQAFYDRYAEMKASLWALADAARRRSDTPLSHDDCYEIFARAFVCTLGDHIDGRNMGRYAQAGAQGAMTKIATDADKGSDEA